MKKNSDTTEGCLTGSIAILATLLLTAFIIVGCSAPRQVTQLVEHVQRDTIYLSNIQYDSIYIAREKDREYRKALPNLETLVPDTLFIRDVSVEYRYKLLRDTFRIVQRDSIPYEVTVTKVKEITRPLTWFDHLTRASFWLIFGMILIKLIALFKRNS